MAEIGRHSNKIGLDMSSYPDLVITDEGALPHYGYKHCGGGMVNLIYLTGKHLTGGIFEKGIKTVPVSDMPNFLKVNPDYKK